MKTKYGISVLPFAIRLAKININNFVMVAFAAVWLMLRKLAV